jgi:hypothetical protein
VARHSGDRAVPPVLGAAEKRIVLELHAAFRVDAGVGLDDAVVAQTVRYDTQLAAGSQHPACPSDESHVGIALEVLERAVQGPPRRKSVRNWHVGGVPADLVAVDVGGVGDVLPVNRAALEFAVHLRCRRVRRGDVDVHILRRQLEQLCGKVVLNGLLREPADVGAAIVRAR